MGERLAALGGRVEIESAPAWGTTVIGTVPVT
jgi:signal transduction histidine kinase